MRTWLTLGLIVFVSTFISVADVKADNAEVHYNKGENAFQSKKYTSALYHYREALKINPYYKEAQIGMGRAYYQLKNYSKALKHFNMAQARFRNEYSIVLWLAKTKMEMSQWDSAESYLLKAIELRPREYEIYIVYGDIYFRKKAYKQAIRYYQKSLKISPKRITADLKIGRSYLMLNKYAKALYHLEIAEEIDNKNPKTNLYLGEYHYRQKDYVSSEKYLKTALRVSPTYVEAMDILFQVFYEMDEWEQAKDLLEKLLAMNPGDLRYHYHLGLALERVGEPDRGLAVLIEGLRDDAGNEGLRFLAESIYHKYYWTNMKVRRRGAYLAAYWFRKGRNYLRQNLTNYSIFAFRRGIRLDPNNWRIRMELAKVYKSQGLDQMYLDELKVLRPLAPANRNINDEIRFTQRALKRRLARRIGINQYDQPRVQPKLALVFFDSNHDFHHHFGVNRFYREILYTTLKMRHRLNVVLIQGKKNFKNDEAIARDQKADYMIKGTVRETKGGVHITLRIFNLKDGEAFRTLKINQRGSSRFLSSALHLASRVEKLFPVIGQIIRKNYKEVYLNIGRRQGYKKGDRFFVIQSTKALNKLLALSNLPRIMNNKQLLRQTLLSYSEDPRHGLQEIRITDIDENVAKGRIVTSDFFNQVNINSHVIYKPR